MVTKIITTTATDGELSQMINDFGTYFITSTNEINEEIAKYKCPFRLSVYIDELKESNQVKEVDEIIADCEFDLSEESKIIADSILVNKYDYDEYIEQTPHFDKYGNSTIMEDDYLQHETSDDSLKLYVK